MIQRQTRRSDEEWMKLIQTCRTSGQSDKDWCEDHAIPVSTFYSKLTKLRKKACDIPTVKERALHKAQQVVPLEIINETPITYNTHMDASISSEMPAVALNINGYRLEIANHAAKETILNTLSVLQQLC